MFSFSSFIGGVGCVSVGVGGVWVWMWVTNLL